MHNQILDYTIICNIIYIVLLESIIWCVQVEVPRSVLFFLKPGSSNTQSVLEMVKKRLELKDIKKVLVPATTGKTAKLFSSEIGDDTQILTISESEIVSFSRTLDYSKEGLLGELIRQRLQDINRSLSKNLRREIFDMTLLPFSGEKWDIVKEILYAFGQGMKVAIEISIAAVELQKVEPQAKIIATGGTEKGVDTAVVLRTSSRAEAFSKIQVKRLIVQEVICMPIEKFE